MPRKFPQKPVNTGMTIMPHILKKLDEARGPIPRSWVLENAIIYYLQQLGKGRITILQNFSSVGSPESSAEQSDVVVSNSPQHRPAKEDAVPVTS